MDILHIFIADYFPFLILLWALFHGPAGGILIQGAPAGTPLTNLVTLFIGTFLGISDWNHRGGHGIDPASFSE